MMASDCFKYARCMVSLTYFTVAVVELRHGEPASCIAWKHGSDVPCTFCDGMRECIVEFRHISNI